MSTDDLMIDQELMAEIKNSVAKLEEMAGNMKAALKPPETLPSPITLTESEGIIIARAAFDMLAAEAAAKCGAATLAAMALGQCSRADEINHTFAREAFDCCTRAYALMRDAISGKNEFRNILNKAT